MKNIKIITSEYRIYQKEGRIFNARFVSFVNYFLRLHFDNKSLDKSKYNWLQPEILAIGPEPGEGVTTEFLDEFCSNIEKQKVDVLGVSVYVWNKIQFKLVCQEVKKRFPHIVIIAGGPELDAHKNPNFFKDNWFYDYVVYGDGERAFTTLLDHLSGQNTELVNVVSSDGTVYPHQVFTDKELMKGSPYLTYKDEIKEVVQSYRSMIIKKYKRIEHLIAIWETTKGCPYTCSFCDWSSGLHNKVRFWGNKKEPFINDKPNYAKELDLFTDIGFHSIQWSNPNVGLSPQDSEIVDYWCKLKKENPATPQSFVLQLSKIKKELTHQLYKKMITHGLEKRLKFDVQDLDPKVIQNLARPEIPWSEHKVMIREFIDEFPAIAGDFRSKINFIWGLPGQTLSHFDFNLTEATQLGMYSNFFYFELLPNSPAGQLDYIEKFELKHEPIYVTHLQLPVDLKHITKDILNEYFTETNLVTSTYSMSRKDWFVGIAKSYIYKRHFFTTMNRSVDRFVLNFSKYQTVIDQMYDMFQENRAIAIQPEHLLETSLYHEIRNSIDKITQEIYS